MSVQGDSMETFSLSDTVSLEEMLAARERRVERRGELSVRFRTTLVGVSMNISGPVKIGPLIERAFGDGWRALLQWLAAAGFAVEHAEQSRRKTGPEGLLAVRGDALEVKKIAVRFEAVFPAGRLFDVDVFTADGEAVPRARIGAPERRCLLCGGDAKACGRSRAHSVPELQRRVRTILEEVYAGKT